MGTMVSAPQMCTYMSSFLLAITADGLAERRWRLMGARSMTEARAFFIARLQRSLSVVIAREMARHRLRRIPFIGVPRAAIRARQPHTGCIRGGSTCHRWHSWWISCASRSMGPAPLPCTPRTVGGRSVGSDAWWCCLCEGVWQELAGLEKSCARPSWRYPLSSRSH